MKIKEQDEETLELGSVTFLLDYVLYKVFSCGLGEHVIEDLKRVQSTYTSDGPEFSVISNILQEIEKGAQDPF